MANEIALKKALEDEAFVKELVEMENPEEVQAALNAKGAEITVDEVKAIAKSLSQQAEGELDEDALEDVAGGSILGVATQLALLPTLLPTASVAVVYNVTRRRRW